MNKSKKGQRDLKLQTRIQMNILLLLNKDHNFYLVFILQLLRSTNFCKGHFRGQLGQGTTSAGGHGGILGAVTAVDSVDSGAGDL